MKYQPFAYFAQNTSSQIDVFMLAEVFFTKNYSVRAGFAKLAYLAAQICIAEFSVCDADYVKVIIRIHSRS